MIILQFSFVVDACQKQEPAMHVEKTFCHKCMLVQVTFYMGVALQKGFFKSLKKSLFR